MAGLTTADPPRRPPSRVTRPVVRRRDGAWSTVDDVLAGEEPMEIRVTWEADGEKALRSVAVTMRTPGDDFELAAGFLHGEQILGSRDDVVDIAYCPDDEEQTFNIVTVTLRPGLALDESRLQRNFYTTSSCGVCGKATLESLELTGCATLSDPVRVAATTIEELPGRLREAQRIFDATGGLHAAGLFTPEGGLIDLKEDVGRHNALDKLIGDRFMRGLLPLAGSVLCLSGRASYELLQKALVARIPVVAAVGAPSSLAVSLAETFDITLLGFVRPGGFNVYTGRERIVG